MTTSDCESAQRAAWGNLSDWREYYDRDALVSDEAFTRMSIAERVDRINACHDRPILNCDGAIHRTGHPEYESFLELSIRKADEGQPLSCCVLVEKRSGIKCPVCQRSLI